MAKDKAFRIEIDLEPHYKGWVIRSSSEEKAMEEFKEKYEQDFIRHLIKDHLRYRIYEVAIDY